VKSQKSENLKVERVGYCLVLKGVYAWFVQLFFNHKGHKGFSKDRKKGENMLSLLR